MSKSECKRPVPSAIVFRARERSRTVSLLLNHPIPVQGLAEGNGELLDMQTDPAFEGKGNRGGILFTKHRAEGSYFLDPLHGRLFPQ